MAIIIEQRLKCDECGVVSPVLSRVPVSLPRGWIQYTKDWTMKDFCCRTHLKAWLAKQPQPLMERGS